MLATILLIIALVIFVIVAMNKPWPDKCCRLLGLGLALWVLSVLLPTLLPGVK